MKKRIVFELLSDVMAGGTRTVTNFLESENFIRGSVLRAGFVSDILLECPIYETYSSENNRNNWIELKDKDGECRNCLKKNICEKFSEMTFTFAYPEGSFPAPFTSRVCKKCGTNHPLQDTIIDSGRILCGSCNGKIRRMENLKGFVKETEEGFKTVKVEKSISVHTAINYNSKTALDGSLFSVNAIKKGQLFTAYIDDKDTGMLSEGKVIYVGKYSSSGFGKIMIKKITECEETNIKDEITEFNEQFGNVLLNGKPLNESGRTYVPLLLLSDAKFDFGDGFKKVKTNKEYMQLWQEKLLGSNSRLRLEKVFAENSFYKGFDTSAEWGNWEKEKPEILTLKGTSFLVSYEKNDINALDELNKIKANGVGNDTINGFGEISVCCKLHKLGVNKNDD